MKKPGTIRAVWGEKREVLGKMAVKSVRHQVRKSVVDQLKTALNVQKENEIPRKLRRMVDAYMSFYDQYWAISATLETLEPTSKEYRELSKERRQVHNSMLTTLGYFDGLASPGPGGGFDFGGLL